MLEQVIGPIVIGACIAGVVIAAMPKEAVLFDPNDNSWTNNDENSDKDKKKTKSDLPKSTSMKEIKATKDQP